MYARMSAQRETPASRKGIMTHTLITYALAIPLGLGLAYIIAKKIVSL